MTVVLDANAALELILRRLRSAEIGEIITNATKVISPELFQYELTNVMAKYVKGGYLAKDAGSKLISYAFELIDEYYPAKDFNQESYHESIRLDHSAYDLFYLILARRTGAKLLTLDKKLSSLAINEGIDLIR